MIRDVLKKRGWGLEATLGEIFRGDDAFFTQFFAPEDRGLAERVSLKALGMHRSGIVPGKMPSEDIVACTTSSLTEDCKNIGFKFIFLADPEDGFRFYSNIAVALLGMVIEKLEGRPFRDIMAERFRRNGIEGVRMREAEARNDVAFGIEATSRGLAALLRKVALKGEELVGFDTSGLQETSGAARASQSKVLWLMETPYEGLWGHGGNLNGTRTHFYWHTESGTGFSAVGEGMKSKGYMLISAAAGKAFNWTPYEKLTPKVWEEREVSTLPTNTSFWLPGNADLVKEGDSWTQEAKEIDMTVGCLVQTRSGRLFLRYRGKNYAQRR